ncbi:hypothetical protein BH23GEM1_BH23GEM1_02050 [soil metagenome]
MIFPGTALAAVAALVLTGVPMIAAAQAAPPLQSEVRLDAITGSAWAIHAGLGLTAPLGTYVRYGVIGGLGAGADGTSGRTDLIARFTLDPFREKWWAPYGVGGVSVRYGGPSRAYLVLMAGVEGPTMGRVAPAIEAGFGGSFRAGVILRQSFPRRR